MLSELHNVCLFSSLTAAAAYCGREGPKGSSWILFYFLCAYFYSHLGWIFLFIYIFRYNWRVPITKNLDSLNATVSIVSSPKMFMWVPLCSYFAQRSCSQLLAHMQPAISPLLSTHAASHSSLAQHSCSHMYLPRSAFMQPHSSLTKRSCSHRAPSLSVHAASHISLAQHSCSQAIAV